MFHFLSLHINSIPRLSLNNQIPFNFIGDDNINKFNIKKSDYDDVDLSIRLLKK